MTQGIQRRRGGVGIGARNELARPRMRSLIPRRMLLVVGNAAAVTATLQGGARFREPTGGSVSTRPSALIDRYSQPRARAYIVVCDARKRDIRKKSRACKRDTPVVPEKRGTRIGGGGRKTAEV